KEIEDFFGDDVRIATAADLAELGFDERYVGWTIASKFNSGDARISGVELSLRQSLRGIGGWGQYFSVFANATKLKLEGDQQASFTSFIPESANWGVTFSKGRVTAGVKWNYRGLDKRIGAPVFGPDAFDYIASRVSLDLDFRYELTPKLALAASVNNALDEPLTMMSYGSQTPGYAQTARIDHSGIQLAVGIKGRF